MSDEDQKFLSPELADALDRAAAAKAKLEAKRAASKPADELREALDEAALAEAILEHGEVGDGIAKVRTGAGLVIVRRPTESRWRRAEKELATRNDGKLEEAGKQLILDHLVLPAKDERDRYFAIVAQYPALPTTLVGLIAGLAAGGSKASGE